MLGRRCSSRQGHHHFQSEQRGVDHFLCCFLCCLLYYGFILPELFSLKDSPISPLNESKPDQVRILVVKCTSREEIRKNIKYGNSYSTKLTRNNFGLDTTIMVLNKTFLFFLPICFSSDVVNQSINSVTAARPPSQARRGFA